MWHTSVSNNKRKRAWLRGIALGAVLALAGAAWTSLRPARAHIIPPEELHPVAEAYRKAVFMLNLNPVVWDLVWAETDVIARHLAVADRARAEAFRKELEAARKIALPEAKEDVTPDLVAAREQGRRAVMDAATRATAAVLLAHLDRAGEAKGRDEAARHLREGRDVFAAWADTLPHHDPEAWKRLGVHWLEATSQLGSEGVLGAGAVPANLPELRAQLQPISGYVRDHFAGFAAGTERWIVARPRRSPTYKEAAWAPVRLPPGTNLNKQIPRPRQILGMAARGVDESETQLIALGDMAFDSSHIFGEPARSLNLTCNTCHNKGVTNPKFFIPGLSKRPGGMDVSSSFFAPHANNGLHDPLDIPDLRGIRFTAPYGRNGRTASLREFTRTVIVHEFGGAEPDPLLLDAMVAYQNEFEFLPNPKLAKDGTLKANQVSAAALRGERLFNRPFPQMMGGKSCATCHIPSDHFLDRRRHDLGSAEGHHPDSRDGAFDTPTLLSARFTAPYFHDGSLPTLRSVVEWFDRRFKLALTPTQIADLTEYLEAVGDGVEPYEATPYYLDAEMQEFGFFLSTYEWLARSGKHELIALTLRTVATEIANHKWELRNAEHRPIMERMAAVLQEALKANQAGKHALVEAKVAEYRKLYKDNADKLK